MAPRTKHKHTLDSPASDPLDKRNGSLIDQIFQGAIQAFMTNGYERVSMDMIAKYARVSRASLYNNFENKEALVRNLMELVTKRFIREVVDVEHAADDPAEELHRTSLHFLTEACRPHHMAVYRLAIAESNRFPWLGEIFTEVGPGAIVKRFHEIIERAERPGNLSAQTLAEQLYSLLIGYYFQFRIMGRTDAQLKSNPRRVVEHALKTLGFSKS